MNRSVVYLLEDVASMTSLLGPGYVLFIRMHPAAKMSADSSWADGVFDVSGYPNVNELLVVTDYLILDYSSLPYEFALLNRPQIFYPYDLLEYELSPHQTQIDLAQVVADAGGYIIFGHHPHVYCRSLIV